MHMDDPKRLAAIRALVAGAGCRAFVETGAWTGDTVLWVAEQFPGLDGYYTCESYPPRFALAHSRVSVIPRAACSPVPSPQFLEDLPADLAEPALFYLDAHFEDYWPLRDELRVIARRWPSAIVMVDDAFVPNRPNFVGCCGGGGEVGDAMYGNRTTRACDGEALDVGLIQSALGPEWRIVFPDYPERAIGYAFCARRGGHDLLAMLGGEFSEAKA
jgi:hypothetical protein